MYLTYCLFFLNTLFFTCLSYADNTSEVSEVLVTPDGEKISQSRQYTTDRVDVIKKDRIEKSSVTTLNEALDRQVGVDSQDYCVNCGAKRISINGLRGDHTSVLIDGVPLYSAISSVYGYDAVSLQSVQEIEVKRGTGGALLNPEAIGGSINIITIDPDETGSKASLFIGDQETQTLQLSHNYVLDNYKLAVGGEYNSQESWDVDNNGFAESPYKSRYSFYLKQIMNLSARTQWVTRLSYADMEIIGGNTKMFKLKEPVTIQASDTDFVDGDVRKDYTGDISRISEYIGVKRSELTSKLTSHIDSKNLIEWNLAGAIYEQESYYMHGFDYLTKNTTLYSDLIWQHQLKENQITKLGLSLRSEFLRSESEIMYDTNNIPRDDFDYFAYSLFAQHEWFPTENLEISSALRLERLENKWLELNSINKTIASPRLSIKWQNTDYLSQQFAYGYGYRMPLTSVESAHGAYDGFIVDITELEKSHSLVYSLSYNTPHYYFTPSAHYTHLENMSYPLDPLVAHSGPLRFVNDQEDHNIFVYDILMGVKPLPGWLVEFSYERFNYTDDYKRKLPTAAIEDRVNIRSEYEYNGYTFLLSGTWIGARNLSKYHQYPNFYNISDPFFGTVFDQKGQKSPAFWQIDASVAKKIKSLELTLGVQNLFDYTQTGEGDSPAMWHLHDNHTHLDNRHVWGPNRGREYYLKLAYKF